MFSRSRSTGLCHSCRQDIQILLERGFCGPAVALRNRHVPLPWRQTPKPRVQLRSFSESSKLLQQNLANPHDRSREVNDRSANIDITHDQIEALRELENAVGQPIEEAIEEDTALAQGLRNLSLHMRSVSEDTSTRVVPGTRDVLAELRSDGAAPEEVVREARRRYGDTLPDTALNDGELKIYKRLYGEPASMTYEELLDEDDAVEVDRGPETQLYDQEGEVIDYETFPNDPITNDAIHGDMSPGPPRPAQEDLAFDDAGTMPSSLLTSPAERAMEIARSLNAEVVDEMVEEEFFDDDSARTHPFTRLGKFATNPGNVQLPQEEFVRPMNRLMSNFSNKHLKEICEKTFGGPGLPDSPLTPRSGRSRAQISIPIDASQQSMGEMEANAFVTTVMPPTYAAVMSVLVETRKRLGSTWLNNLLAKEGGPRILDAGAGGAGIIAWRELIQAHWDAMHDSDRDPPPPPASKSVVLTGSDTLRHRAAALLENTTFVPRLPNYIYTRNTPTLEDDRPAQQRKQFDVVIAAHSLFGLQEDYMKKQHVENLWSMTNHDGGVLILIEKGVPRGFEAIAGARELLLERHIAIPEGNKTAYSEQHQSDDTHVHEPGMIIAPCTNHEKCPMYRVPGPSKGRKDFCSFQQRYIRPNYLQRVLGARDRNHDDVDFSYLSVMRGDDLRRRQVDSWLGIVDGLSAPNHPDPKTLGEDHKAWMQLCQSGFEGINPNTALTQSNPFIDGKERSTLPATWNLPRLVFPPMKRRGHIIMDVCTPEGQIERWTVPRSFGKQAYRDARKSRWGDLWALGAKTRIARSLRLGGPDTKEARRARNRNERLKDQAEELMEKMEQEKMAEMEEVEEFASVFEDDLVEDIEMPVARTAKFRKNKPPTAQSIETFSFDDIEAGGMNHVKPPQTHAARKIASKVSSTKRSEERAETSEDDDLSDDDWQTLEQWEKELSSVQSRSGKSKRLRTYSKFAPPGQKTRARKDGKMRRAGGAALGR
ncbi:37S ribosomal protein S22 [Rhinocladiella similis]